MATPFPRDYLAFVPHALDLIVEFPGLKGVANAHLGIHGRVVPRDAPICAVQLTKSIRESALQRASNLFQVVIISCSQMKCSVSCSYKFFDDISIYE